MKSAREGGLTRRAVSVCGKNPIAGIGENRSNRGAADGVTTLPPQFRRRLTPSQSGIPEFGPKISMTSHGHVHLYVEPAQLYITRVKRKRTKRPKAIQILKSCDKVCQKISKTIEKYLYPPKSRRL
jgi:hypothetical protein